jgi:prophage antirepressor-like protein
MQTITKFLEFNGKRINILLADGNWYVAIKPICESLKVDYIRAFKNANEDEILSQLLSEQTMVAADGRLRKMTCLPEKFIYGWIFSLRSESEELKKYRLICYEVLYEHFHGQITYRANALSHKSEIRERKAAIKAQLAETDLYKEYLELDKKEKVCNRRLDSLDIDLISKQISMIL